MEKVLSGNEESHPVTNEEPEKKKRLVNV